MLTTERATVTSKLRLRFPGAVSTPGDNDWDEVRLSFNLLVDQQPTAVARPRDAAEAAQIVAAVRDAGLRIAPQGSGHNAAPLGSLGDTVVVKLDRMVGVTVNAGNRTARVEAGARWWDVTPLAAEFGLSALHGSSPEVNVVGYSLGGGVGWQARKHGLQSNSITAIDLVTADGELRRVDAEHDPELFWAVRGGGGSFGLVTAIEFQLYPLAELYAGSMFFPFEQSAEILHAWREWTAMLPDEVTSAVRMLQIPDLEVIPEMLRAKSFAVVGAAYLGGEDDGYEIVRPLCALNPAINTFATVPAAALAELHMDPTEPAPYMSGHSLLSELPPKLVDELVALAGPGSDSMLAVAELRHIGGALSRAPQGAGAAATIEGEYMSFAVGPVMAPEMAVPIEAQLVALAEAYAPYECGRYLNFTEEEHDVAEFFDGETLARLRRAKQTYDPDGLFRANHPITASPA